MSSSILPSSAPAPLVISYPEELPVSQRRRDIANTIAANQVVIDASTADKKDLAVGSEIGVQVEGPVDVSGFEIAQVDSDRRLRFTGPVGATSTLVLDGGTGNVLIDGTSDRGGLLTYRDWPTIPPGASVEFAFIPLGVTSSARLTAVIRPGSW